MKRVVSQSEFAEIVGIGRSAICNAIADGRLRRSVVIGPNGRWMLDLDKALLEFEQSTDFDQSMRARAPRRW
jgi:hypothetical protein